MSDASVVRLVDWYLEGLQSTVRATATDLGNGSYIPNVDFHAARHIDTAWNEFSGRWNVHRNELASVLAKVAEALDHIQQNFSAADAASAKGLAGNPSNLQGSSSRLQGGR